VAAGKRLPLTYAPCCENPKRPRSARARTKATKPKSTLAGLHRHLGTCDSQSQRCAGHCARKAAPWIPTLEGASNQPVWLVT